ncbi:MULTISPECIES: CII family transcriptional regulator [unclassified Variovorax]|uniref:CII family transcriptional regulator n=1 Tax=unclassified Variovorax TaxID=663243 RepID=UPI0008394C65|nr:MULTISPECIES: CII family transcriptional regulator [unclassified Variovorax]PNG53200.1 hypothetical protein CHC06_04546 [Variovorax sp. B2]PNG53772.1 hypothetical protein CHC07_03593 [Variovorax sp. B4]VTV11226.1 hypothetical protein WDL1CHR_02107 [Variovorax sp. WDL1]
MAASSPTVHERARKTQMTILRALQEPGRQVALATSMGISESTVSRLKNDQLEQFSELLAHLGLKVVNQEMQCFPPDQIQALLTLSKVHLASIERPDQLVWE